MVAHGAGRCAQIPRASSEQRRSVVPGRQGHHSAASRPAFRRNPISEPPYRYSSVPSCSSSTPEAAAPIPKGGCGREGCFVSNSGATKTALGCSVEFPAGLSGGATRNTARQSRICRLNRRCFPSDFRADGPCPGSKRILQMPTDGQCLVDKAFVVGRERGSRTKRSP